MSRLTRKFVAVLMLLWLPLFTGSALAASEAMQLRSSCQGMDMSAMQHQMSGHHHAASTKHVQQGTSCNDCGVCHVACGSYLAAPALELAVGLPAGLPSTPYLVSFSSFTPALLDPPPLAVL